MNSSGISDGQVLEVASDPFRLSLDASKVMGGGLDELQLGSRWWSLSKGLCVGRLGLGASFNAPA